jgi:cobalt-precorrin 5A hydrolase
MNWALIAVTRRGAGLAKCLQIKLGGEPDIFVKAERHSLTDGFEEYHELKPCIAKIFHRYDALLFIAATGIVVRMIAPHLEKKTMDPAVLVLDEQGKHVISLLSGHIGRANELTTKIAAMLDAQPVITTATDVNGSLAADVLAGELNLTIFPLEHLKHVNRALAEGAAVSFYIDKELKGRDFYEQQLRKKNLSAKFVDNLAAVSRIEQPAVVLTNRAVAPIPENMILLMNRKLAIGIGCRRGTSEQEILTAIDAACKKIAATRQDIGLLASTVVKQDEGGLLAAAHELGVPIYFYENDQLQQMIDRCGLEISPFVKRQIGVGSVCEAAALQASSVKKLILKKEKFSKVTVAIAWEK